MNRYKTVGSLLEDNKAIFNYIYDKFGFRIGIVLACKGIGQWHPRMAYALFKEVDCNVVTHTKMNEIPVYKNLYKYDSETQKAEIPNDVPMIPIKEYYPIDRYSKIELFELALDRINYNSFTYYVNENPDYGQSGSSYRDKPYFCCYYDTEIDENSDDYGYIKAIRKAIKETEFRAFKYFKK